MVRFTLWWFVAVAVSVNDVKEEPSDSPPQESPGVGSVVVSSSFSGLVPGHTTLDLDVNEEHESFEPGFALEEEDCPLFQDQAQEPPAAAEEGADEEGVWAPPHRGRAGPA